MKKLLLYYHTLRYLKPRQLYYRVYYKIRKLAGIKQRSPEYKTNRYFDGSAFTYFVELPVSWLGGNTFRFLNREVNFGDQIDWNYKKNGKLWTYNLNYFEWLMQPGLKKNDGLYLINDYIDNTDQLIDGKEPFPTSLRLINWIKFLIKNKICDERIDRFIHEDAYRLYHHPEYHLSGNHLLENGFGLYFAACYLHDEKLYKLSEKILTEELEEQILEDGAHFELSTMYHQHMLFRVLDCYQLSKNVHVMGADLQGLFLDKGQKMLSFLEQISFRNGDMPLLNDSARGIAPDSIQLFNYASDLKIDYSKIPLSASGYRRYDHGNIEVIADAGNIGPDYIPGHAHADSLSFVMNYNNRPFITDTGTSTYEAGETRQMERSTCRHNTVELFNKNSSEVWAVFRVGKRARTIIRDDEAGRLCAAHDGYREEGVTTVRDIKYINGQVIIDDIMEGDPEKTKACKAHFHFHPGINFKEADRIFYFSNGLKMEFINALAILDEHYEYAEQWNETQAGRKLIACFDQQLQTIISEA